MTFSKTSALFSFVLIAMTPLSGNAAVFNIDRIIGTASSAGSGSITGTVTTDGTIGVLEHDNILGWDIVVDTGDLQFNLFGSHSSGNSVALLFGDALVAENNKLLFDFSGDNSDWGIVEWDYSSPPNPAAAWTVQTYLSSVSPESENYNERIYIRGFGFRIDHRNQLNEGVQVLGVSEVPVPAAAWLFGSALLGLGAMKRKQTT